MLYLNSTVCNYCNNSPIYAFTDYKNEKSVILGYTCDEHFVRGKDKLQLVNRKAKARKKLRIKKRQEIKAYKRKKKIQRKLAKKNTP